MTTVGRGRDVDWLLALAGVVIALGGAYFGRSAPGLWVSAIRYANAPRCEAPGQRDCVRHLRARVTHVYTSESRPREHEVSYFGDPSLAVITERGPVPVAPGAKFDRLSLGAAAPVTLRVWEGRVTAIERDGFGQVETWDAPRHAAVHPTGLGLAGILAGLAVVAAATRRQAVAVASAVAAVGAAAPTMWLADRFGPVTAPEALAVFLVVVTAAAWLLRAAQPNRRSSVPSHAARRSATGTLN